MLEYIIKVGLCVDEGVLTFRILHTIILVIRCRNTEGSTALFTSYNFPLIKTKKPPPVSGSGQKAISSLYQKSGVT